MSAVEETQQWDTDRVLTIPNVLSFIRLLSVVAFGWLIMVGADVWAVGLLVVFGATDALDGYLARRLRQRTALGAKLDPVADRLYILVALVALAVRGIVPWWFFAILLGRDLMLVALLPSLRRMGLVALPVNTVGKAATLALLTAFPLVLLGAPQSLGIEAAKWIGWVLAVLGAMLYWWAGGLYVSTTVALARERRPDDHA